MPSTRTDSFPYAEDRSYTPPDAPLFQRWTPDLAVRERVLVTNPAKLYRL